MHGKRTDPIRLRELIVARRMTVKAFYEKAGISKSLAFAVLADPPRRDLSDVRAVQVAEALGCAVEDFTMPEAAVVPSTNTAVA